MKLYKYFTFIFILLLLVSSTVFAILKNNRREISGTIVSFKEGHHAFLNSEMVNKLLILSLEKSNNKTKDILDLSFIEADLEGHPVIKSAEAFLLPSKVLRINIEERIPLLRVMGKETFYIDDMAVKIPLSNHFTAHVPLFFGNIEEVQKDKLIHFMREVNSDDFMKNEVIQIEKVKEGYLLNLRSYDFVVEWGNFEKYNEKVIKLKALCKYLKMQKETHHFKRISLKYNKQVIASN